MKQSCYCDVDHWILKTSLQNLLVSLDAYSWRKQLAARLQLPNAGGKTRGLPGDHVAPQTPARSPVLELVL